MFFSIYRRPSRSLKILNSASLAHGNTLVSQHLFGSIPWRRCQSSGPSPCPMTDSGNMIILHNPSHLSRLPMHKPVAAARQPFDIFRRAGRVPAILRLRLVDRASIAVELRAGREQRPAHLKHRRAVITQKLWMRISIPRPPISLILNRNQHRHAIRRLPAAIPTAVALPVTNPVRHHAPLYPNSRAIPGSSV